MNLNYIIQIEEHNKDVLCSGLSDRGKSFVDWLIRNYTIIHSNRTSHTHYTLVSHSTILLNNTVSDKVRGNILHVNHIIEDERDMGFSTITLSER